MEFRGKLRVIRGPMRSGKSAHLIHELDRHRYQHVPVLVFRPAKDSRSRAEVVESRNGTHMPAIVVSAARDILKFSDLAMVIGIDEVQFFDPEIIDIVRILVQEQKEVIVAGLNLDYRGQALGSLPELLCLADEVTDLKAVCAKCMSEDASRTQLVLPSTSVVGGDEQFEPRCVRCFDPPAPYRLDPRRLLPEGSKIFDSRRGTVAQATRPFEGFGFIGDHISDMHRELVAAAEQLSQATNLVAFFGSARADISDPNYAMASRISTAVAERGLGVITGGGPGLMEAVNVAAFTEQAHSVGLTIRLPNEQMANDFLTVEAKFDHLRTRKFIYLRHACAFIVLPGGLGTLDEVAELLCLIKTGQYPRLPVFLVDDDTGFFEPLVRFIEGSMLKHGYATKEDRCIFKHVRGNDENAVDEMLDDIERFLGSHEWEITLRSRVMPGLLCNY